MSIVVVPSDSVCDYDESAEVEPSADLAGTVTAGMTFREKHEDGAVIPSGTVCDYGDYFYDALYDCGAILRVEMSGVMVMGIML